MGRPVGSKNGRIPEGGYPPISDELGGFLAGFIEGEACFLIASQSGFGYRCAMTLNSRADDALLIAELVNKSRLGTVRTVEARRTSLPQVRWSIAAKSDCCRLVEILDRYPLRGRKSRDFAIWRAGLEWWVGDDPTRRRPNRDWEPLIYLKRQLHQSKRYKEPGVPVTDDGPATGLSPDWRPFLAGFATAEAGLVINRASEKRYVPRLRINLRADDLQLLAQLHRRTGIGRLFAYQRAGNPVASWVVSSREDLGELVRLLDLSRLRGRKGREYAIWREAVDVCRAGADGSGPRMRELGEFLLKEREYRDPPARLTLKAP